MYDAREVSTAVNERLESELRLQGVVLRQLAFHQLSTEAKITELRRVK